MVGIFRGNYYQWSFDERMNDEWFDAHSRSSQWSFHQIVMEVESLNSQRYSRWKTIKFIPIYWIHFQINNVNFKQAWSFSDLLRVAVQFTVIVTQLQSNLIKAFLHIWFYSNETRKFQSEQFNKEEWKSNKYQMIYCN